VLSSRTPLRMHLSHPMLLACRRRPLDTGTRMHSSQSSICHTRVHSARTPTTRPLPRPAAIASRHATSRAMQVATALPVSQAAPAALFSPHSPCLSLFGSCKPTRKALHIVKEGGEARCRWNEARVDEASLRCHHQGLLHTLATPSLPLTLKSQAVVLWPGLIRQPTYDACSRAVGSGTCTHLGRWGLWAATGAAAASRADRRSMERRGGHVQGEEGEGQGVMPGPRGTQRTAEAGLEASMAHVRQDAASGWSLGPDMTCLPCLR
jgi:hypothetical protein